MHVLVSGAGIAGLTLGLCLNRAGVECTIVEKAGLSRSAGYMIDFFGSGYDAAERLDLLADLEQIHYPISALRFLRDRGRENVSISYPAMRRLFDDRHFNFMRGELEQVLLCKIQNVVQILHERSIDSVEQNENGVIARLTDGSEIHADLLVGADGIHSRVRALAWGEEQRFARFLGCNTAAFTVAARPKELSNLETFDTLTVPGRQVAVYPIRGGKLATFFVHNDRKPASRADDPLVELRRMYGNMDWIVPDLLDRAHGEIYYDSVSQIEVPSWRAGRVLLIGDAAWCVSLIAGQGASLALAGSYLLAEELSVARGNVAGAIVNFERRLRPAVEEKQRSGRSMAKWFVPGTSFRLSIRDSMMRLVGWRPADRLLKRLFATESVLS